MAQINLDIVTRTNLQGLNQLKAKLQEVSKSAQSTQGLMVGTYSATEIQKTIRAVNTLERALTMAYDKKLNTVNVQKFNQYLAKSNLTIKDLYTHLSRLGAEGQQAFIKMSQTALTMGRSIKKTNKLVTEMKTTMVNTFKWGISSGLWNTMLSSVSKAFNYVKGLDKDLNNIRIVTGKSADQMERFAKTANKAAKDLAVSTRDYTQGALIYYQQGDDDETVAKKTEVTAKAANVTGQDMSAVSEQLTAVWNGYQVANQAAKEGMQVYEEYVDKMAAVGAETASDLEELATAMSKVASAAHSMGVDFDQLNAQISTIVSVTRQAPESVGTALKTIYARLGDLKVDGVDEFGTKLGEVSSQLKTMGIDVVDSNGQMREMGTVMTEVASKWDGWTSSQKQAAAVAMAGKRQYNNLIALFDNWDMYSESLETSMGAAGTLTEQQGIAVESLDKKMQRLSTAGEKIYDALFDKESLGGFIDGLSTVVDLIGSAVEGVGGLSTLLPAVSGMLLKSFGGNIANSFAEKAENNRIREKEKQNDFAKRELAKQLGDKGNFLKANGEEDTLMANEQGALVKHYKEMAKYREQMTDEEIAASNEIFKRRAELANEKIQTEEQLEILKKKKAISKEEYDLLIKKNKADKELTEDEKRRIENIEQENIKRREMYEKIQTLAIEESDLPDYNDTEAAKDYVQKYKTEFNLQKNLIPSYLDENEQMKQVAPSVTNIMTKAAREGASEEDVMNQVRQKLEGIEGLEDPEETLENLKTIYSKMKEDTQKFVEGLENDFESVLGENLRQSLGDEAGPMIDNLKEKVIALQKTGLSMQEAYIQAMEQIRQESEDTASVLEQVDVQIADQAAIEEEMEAAKANQELKEGIEGITTVVGGATQAWGGLNGVINSFASAMDPTLDSTERLKAAFMGLITSAPILINGITTMVNGYKKLQASLGTTTLLETVSTGVLKIKDFIITKLNKAVTRNTSETVENAGASIANAGAQGVEGASMGASTGLINGNTTALGANTAATTGLTAAAGALAIALVAVVAVVAVVVLAMASYQASLEAEKRAAQDNAKAKRELAEAAKEEKDSIDALTDSYKSLQEQYEEDSLSLNELQIKTADLCIEYGRQDLALKALIADYKELNGIIDQAQNEANEDYIRKGRVSINADKKAMVKTIMSDGDASVTDEVNGRDALDIVSGPAFFANSREKKIQKLLAQYGVKTIDGHVYTDQFVDAITKHYDEIYSALANIDVDASRDLMGIMELVADNVKETKGTFDAVGETKKSTISKNYKNRDIETFQEYSNVIDEMTKEVEQYFDSVEDAKAWAESQLISNQDNKRFALINDLAKKQAEAMGGEGAEVTDEIINQLEKLSQEELNFASKYFDMKAIDETFEMFATKYSDFITDLNKENQIVPTIEFILNDADAKEVTKEQLDNLFSTDDFSEAMNITKEQFEALDFDKQRLMMSQYFVDYQKYLTENKDAIVKSIEETAEELDNMNIKFEEEDKNWFTKEGDIDFIKTQYGDTFNSILDKLRMSYDQLAVALEKYYVSEETLTEKEKNLIAELEAATNKELLVNFDGMYGYEIEEAYGEKIGSILEEAHWRYEDLVNVLGSSEKTEGEQKVLDEIAAALGKTTKLNFKDMGKAISLNKRYQAQVEATTAALKKAKEGEADYAGALAAVRGHYPLINEGIDNIQEGFSTLSSIVEDFNDDGTLSLDSLQTLLTMSEDMLACLELENGQMTINGDKMKEMTLARLEEAKAIIWQETQTGLLAIVTGETAEAENNAAYQAFMLAETVTKGAAAAQESGEEWLKYNAIVAGVDLSSIYNNPQALEFMEQQRIKMQAYNSAMEGIKNSDFTTISGDKRNEEKKFFEDEFDRYWKLNKAIDATSKAMNKLADAQDYLFRQELQDNIKETNNLLEDQIKNYEALYKEQKKEAGELQSSLLGYGVTFDTEGNIKNYAEAAEYALSYYNDVVERYNKGTVTEDQLNLAEKSYEEFKKQLERYDELYYNEMSDTAEKIADMQREVIENNLKSFELEIEIKLDEEEFEREVNDFLSDINRDFTKTFEDIGATINQATVNAFSFGESFKTVEKGIKEVEEEILKLHNGEDSDMFSSITEAQEKYKELIQDAMTHAQDMKAAYEDAWNAYLDGISQSQEKFDKIQNQYSRVNEELEYQRQLIELIYGPEAYGMMSDFYKRQQENSLSQIAALQTEKELWEAQLKETAEGSADRIAIEERLLEIQSNLNDSVTTYIQLLKDEYANTVSGILDNFETQLTGSSLDEVEEEWERLTAHSDEYFNNIEGLYHTQTLANKIQESINNTSSVKNQQKLQDLYNKEIGYLREKEELTQFDLDAANARYEIALKEIALEEARENKDSMKLMRDSSGNWSYQYVANEEEVAKKAQELSDAMYKLYELSDSAYKKNLESLQQLNRDYLEKAQEIATSQVLSEDEKELKLKELRDWYLYEYERKVGENETIRQTLSNATVGVLKGLYDQDQTNIEHMSDEEQKAIKLIGEEGIKSFQELEEKAALNINGIGNAINTIAIKDIPEMTSKSQELANVWGADDGASVKAQSLDALNQIISTSTDYQTKMDEVAATVKEDWSESGIKGAIDSTTQATKDAEQAIKDLCNDTTSDLEKHRQSVASIKTEWANVESAIDDVSERMAKLYGLEAPAKKENEKKVKNITGDANNFAEQPDTVKINKDKDKDKSSGGFIGANDVDGGPSKYYALYEDSIEGSKMIDYIPVEWKMKQQFITGHNTGPYKMLIEATNPNKGGQNLKGYSDMKALTYDQIWEIKNKQNQPHYSASLLPDKKPTFPTRLPLFDTGGYTGEWGPEGKTAILHEKELVLNKEDTKNLLSAIRQLRKISLSFIEEQYNNALAKTQLSNSSIYQNIEDMYKRNLASMTAEIANLNVRATYEAETKELEKAKNQIFNIQAEFPNANSVDEIREAILSLPGLASQQMGLNLL